MISIVTLRFWAYYNGDSDHIGNIFHNGDEIGSVTIIWNVRYNLNCLQWVLHDWNDELSVKILKKCKEAISGKGKEGKVIIIDIAIDETSDDGELTELKLDYDLVMLTMFNGKERERKEWEKLIYGAGFSSYDITPICGFKSLIQLYP